MSDTVNLFIFLTWTLSQQMSHVFPVLKTQDFVQIIGRDSLISGNVDSLPHTHTYTNYGNPIILCSD